MSDRDDGLPEDERLRAEHSFWQKFPDDMVVHVNATGPVSDEFVRALVEAARRKMDADGSET